MMPLRIEGFALGLRLEKIPFVFLINVHFADAQQKLLGVFEKNQLLQEIEEQHVELVVRQLDLACLARLNRVEVVDHHVRRRVSSVTKQFRQIAPGRFKGDIGGAEVFAIFLWDVERNTKTQI